MTTNNTPIAAWAPSTALTKIASRHNNSPCVLTDGPAEFNDVALVRLSDYQRLQADHERLQAECERLKRGSEIRDEQNQDLHAFVMELKAECEKLVEALERISKRASEAECRQTPCGPIQRLFVDIMQQADDALAAHHKQGGE